MTRLDGKSSVKLEDGALTLLAWSSFPSKVSRSAGSVQQWLIVNQPGAFGSNYGLHSHTRQWALPQAVLKCNQHFFSNWCKMRPLTFLCGKACAKFDHNVYVWVWLDMINIVEFEVEQVLDMNVKTSQRGGYLVAAISVEKSKKCCLGSCTPTTITTTTHPTAITANQKSEHLLRYAVGNLVV